MFLQGQIDYRPTIVRVLHDLEVPEWRRNYRPNLPEVHPLFPNHHSAFGRTWQLTSKALNPRISNAKWRIVYWWKLWITNHQGFDKPDDPRVDFVGMRDIGAPVPRVEALTTGGSILTGHFEGIDFVVKTLSVHDPVTDIAWLLNHPWFLTYAVTIDSHGKPRPFPQGIQPNGENVPIVHPLIADPRRFTRITIQKWKVKEWTKSWLPNPYEVYSPA